MSRRRQDSKRVRLFDALRAGRYQPAAGWDDPQIIRNCEIVASAGFNRNTLPLACVTVDLLADRQPDTIRGAMYSVVSAGWLPNTSDPSYMRVQRILDTLRKRGVIPLSWIVDNIRATIKPSSWNGLADFADTVAEAYRKDFWSSLPEYVAVIVEKDTVAGRIAQVTKDYDIALHPLRGFSSTTFTYGIAEEWNRITKPITAYYIGDFDPSGIEIEQSVRRTLTALVKAPFTWERLAVNAADFDRFDIIPLEPKKKDSRYKKFVQNFGDRCAEVEAVPADELRNMVRAAIESHIPTEQWKKLKALEATEKESWNRVMAQIKEAA